MENNTDTQLAIMKPIEQAIVKKSEIGAMLDKLTEYKAITVNGIDDKDGYKKADTVRKEIKKVRILTVNICKDGREDANKIASAWIAKEKELKGKFEEVEAHLQAETDKIDTEKQRIADEKAKADELRLQGRVKLLIDSGCAFDGFNYSIAELSISMPIIREMEDGKFDDFMQLVAVEFDKEQKEKAAKEREARTAARKIRVVDAGLALNEEQTAYIYRALFFNVTEIETLADAEFNLQIEEYKAAIAAARKAEIDKLKKEQEQLEKDKEEIRNHRLQVRGELCMHAGLTYSQSTKSYDFENKYTSQHIDAAYLETVDSETFTAALESAKVAIVAAKEKQAEADQKEGERLKLIATRIVQVKEKGLAPDGDNFRHPLYRDTVINADIMDTNEDSWSEFMDLLDTSIEKNAKEAADRKAKEIQDKIDAGIKEAADKAEAARLKKIDDDAKELADREKQAALAPDKEKLSVLAATIHNIVIPDCNTEEGKKIAEEIRGLLLKVEAHIVKNVKAL